LFVGLLILIVGINYVCFDKIASIYNYNTSSNSALSLMGAIRFIAQSISREMRFILILFSMIILTESYSSVGLMIWQ